MSALTIAPVPMTVVRLTLPVPSKVTPLASTSPVSWNVRPVARAVAVAALPVVEPEVPDTLPVTLPVKLAVTVPAVKLPDASRATIAEAVLAEVAVVAELETLLAVEIVPNLVSAIAALALMSALTIVPSVIIVLVTVPVSVVLTILARVIPWAVVVSLMWLLASRKSTPIAM